MRFRIQHVRYMPSSLEEGILYVSKEFETAAHLCACGCKQKVRTPLGPTEWTLSESKRGPSLYPSIGNWQLPCKSHYIINKGDVVWARQWSKEEIDRGRAREKDRRDSYYKNRRKTVTEVFLTWLYKKKHSQ